MHKSIAFEMSRRGKGETSRSVHLRWCTPQAFRSESKTRVINRRLYLESPIKLQRLLIVPYKLGAISSRNNRDNSPHFQRAQDNNGNLVRGCRTIATAETIEEIMGMNNNRCLTIGQVSTEANRRQSEQ